MIPTADIKSNPEQPRREFSYEKLLELAQSIGENGLIHPITIAFQKDKPVLIAGERRLRAAKIAGMKEIPCIKVEAEGLKVALLALIENLQREDMNCFEEAEGIKRLIAIHNLTQEEVANKLGCAQSTIANHLRLLKLSKVEQHDIIAAGLTERHARSLLRLEDEEVRNKVLKKIIQDKLNVAQTEHMIYEILHGKEKRKKPLPLIKDVRLFFNTVNNAVDTMKRSGIKASAEKTETDEYIEYIVRIPKESTTVNELFKKYNKRKNDTA